MTSASLVAKEFASTVATFGDLHEWFRKVFEYKGINSPLYKFDQEQPPDSYWWVTDEKSKDTRFRILKEIHELGLLPIGAEEGMPWTETLLDKIDTRENAFPESQEVLEAFKQLGYKRTQWHGALQVLVPKTLATAAFRLALHNAGFGVYVYDFKQKKQSHQDSSLTKTLVLHAMSKQTDSSSTFDPSFAIKVDSKRAVLIDSVFQNKIAPFLHEDVTSYLHTATEEWLIVDARTNNPVDTNTGVFRVVRDTLLSHFFAKATIQLQPSSFESWVAKSDGSRVMQLVEIAHKTLLVQLTPTSIEFAVPVWSKRKNQLSELINLLEQHMFLKVDTAPFPYKASEPIWMRYIDIVSVKDLREGADKVKPDTPRGLFSLVMQALSAVKPVHILTLSSE